MSEQQQNDRGESADQGFTPPGFEDTAERVRLAMADQAEQVDPSPDAYARVARRVVDESETRRRLPPWMPPARSLVAGVAGLTLLAGGFAVLGSTDDADRDVVSIDAAASGDASSDSGSGDDSQGSAGTAQGTDDGAASNADASSSDADDAAAASPGEPSPAVPSAVAGPVAATRLEAAEAFLDLLGVEPAAPVDVDTDGDGVGDQLIVKTTQEGGSDLVHPVAELDLVEVVDGSGSGWTVVGATSDSVSIEQPIADQTLDSPFVVAGSGTGFEAWIDVEVRSAVDGSVLHLGGASGGNFEPAPFSYEAEVLGTHRAWVIARSSGGADGVALPFTAVPVTIEAAPDPTVYVVATVALDDADGGLNLRAGPGVGNDKLGVVGWGQAVRRTAGVTAERRGDDVWWPVTDDEGNEGWVNARFLAPASPLDGEQLTTGGQQFLLSASNPDYTGSWFPVSSRLGFTVVARGETVRLAASDLGQPSGWTTPVIGGSSLSELVSAPLVLRNEAVFRPNGQEYVDPAMEDVALRYFAGLPSVTATYLGGDGQAHTTHIFFENDPTGYRYVGAIIEASKS